MIARLRDWLLHRDDHRKLPDPTFGPRMTVARRRGVEKKAKAIRDLQEMGVNYDEINRAAFGRPPYSERRGGHDAQ